LINGVDLTQHAQRALQLKADLTVLAGDEKYSCRQ
jgi:hypothetical protein